MWLARKVIRPSPQVLGNGPEANSNRPPRPELLTIFPPQSPFRGAVLTFWGTAVSWILDALPKSLGKDLTFRGGVFGLDPSRALRLSGEESGTDYGADEATEDVAMVAADYGG